MTPRFSQALFAIGGTLGLILVGTLYGRSVRAGDAPEESHRPQDRPPNLVGHLSSEEAKVVHGLRIPASGHIDSHWFIDGSVNPELIPDTLAYATFFRMLLPTDASSEMLLRQRSYLRHVLRAAKSAVSGPPAGPIWHGPDHGASSLAHTGGGDVPSADSGQGPGVLPDGLMPNENDLAAFSAFVSSYEEDIRAFDADVRPLGYESLEETRLVERVSRRMDEYLTPTLRELIDAYVRGEFKRKIKVFP